MFGFLYPYFLHTFNAGELVTSGIMSVMWGCMYGPGRSCGDVCLGQVGHVGVYVWAR